MTIPTEFKRLYRILASLVLLSIPWWFVVVFFVEHPPATLQAKIILPLLWFLEAWILVKWWIFKGKDE
jgi:hypothetical protein